MSGINPETPDNSIRKILIIFMIVLSIFLLSVLANILIPLVFASFLALMFQPMVKLLERIKTPKILITPILTLVTVGILFLFYMVIAETVLAITEDADYLSQKFSEKLEGITEWLNSMSMMLYLKEIDYNQVLETVKQKLGEYSGYILGGIGSFSGTMVIFIIYFVILVAGLPNYKSFIKHVAGERNDKLIGQIDKVKSAVFHYIRIKFIISLVTGILMFSICTWFGIKFALLWGFLGLVLNFIPNFGSMIAAAPPFLMAFIQCDDIADAFILLILIAVSQFSLGNFIEPKLMGRSLRLNTLTVIFGLVFWGYIWGLAGMILSVPLIVMLKIIFEEIPSLSIISRMMESPPKK